jgi:hypothetical protein
MTPADWRNMASMWEAGIAEAKQTPYNKSLFRPIEIMDAMARRCYSIAGDSDLQRAEKC